MVNAHRNQAGLDQVVEEIEASGGKAMAALADVSDPEAVTAMVARANERFGSVDIVVSNVSIRVQHPFLKMTAEEWRHTFDTNLHPSFYLAKETIPGMMERRWGALHPYLGIGWLYGPHHQ